MKFKKLLSIVISFCFLFNAFGEEMPEVIENEKGEPIGIILHLPQDLIDACKCSFWKLKDDELKKHVENCMKNQQGFFKWCEENSCGTKYLHSKRCEIAYALLLANEQGYIIDKNFCKETALDKIFVCLAMRGAVFCSCSQQTITEKYINYLGDIIEYYF